MNCEGVWGVWSMGCDVGAVGVMHYGDILGIYLCYTCCAIIEKKILCEIFKKIKKLIFFSNFFYF